MRLSEMIYTEEEMQELMEENKTLKDKIEFLTNCLDDRDKSIELIKEENKTQKEYYIIACEKVYKLEEENELLKQCLDKLMFTADVVNVKIHGELGDYVYVRSDKQLKLNIED